nr:MAG TPA: hypothetical protein [Caudoviricetes sp.]
MDAKWTLELWWYRLLPYCTLPRNYRALTLNKNFEKLGQKK